jgi:hypothetical protein
MKRQLFIIFINFILFSFNINAQMVNVNRWVSPVTGDFTTIPENKSTDAALISWGYKGKIYQYQGYLTRPAGDNTTTVNRWEMGNCKEFIMLAEHEIPDAKLTSWGYKNKQFLFYAYRTRPSTGSFVAVSRWINTLAKGNTCRDFTLSVTETELTDAQLTSWGYTGKLVQFYVPDPRVNVSTRVMTRFDPTVHGFKFYNDFTSNFAGIDFKGLCGGMAYSALDYFNNNIPVPTQTNPPENGTSLRQYIYNRQQNSTLDNVDKWGELSVNPFGSRTNEFFNWGLQGFNGGRVQELRASIDAGKPVPLGLYKGGNGGFVTHHQVLAIGYDMGRYRGDLGQYKEDLRIYVYDSNFPNQTKCLRPNLVNQTYYYEDEPRCSWLTYFVDKKYRLASPPR